MNDNFSALPKQLKRNAFSALPPLKEDYKKAETLKNLFSRTARSGAGGTRAGTVGLRPSGRITDKLIDDFTPGRLKPKAGAFTEALKQKEPDSKHEGSHSQVIGIQLPRTFCPECNRTDIEPKQGALNVGFYPFERADIHLPAFQLVISYLCQECLLLSKGLHDNLKDPAKHLIFISSDGPVTPTMIRAQQRLKQIEDNRTEYIKSQILSNNPSIFPNGDPFAK